MWFGQWRQNKRRANQKSLTARNVGAKCSHVGNKSGGYKYKGGRKWKSNGHIWSARNAERDFFPLDERLGLLPGNLSPYCHESLVRLGAWIPFEPVAQLLKEMLGVQVSKATVVRDTEEAGAAYVAIQTKEADRIEREAPTAPVGGSKMAISVDGVLVPVRHGEWAEVKNLVIGEVHPPVMERGEPVVHTQKLSYFSRLETAERFQHLTLVEMHRRGVEHSQQVGAVMDGAEWEQRFVDYHYPQAVRILDFPHAGQRIGAIGQVCFGETSPETSQWTSERLHQLKHQGPDMLLIELSQLQQQHSQSELVAENLAYLEKRRLQMQYPQFQAQGWPIGSGMVESGNKLVVEARLKGAGMHWKREHVDPMLGLRNIICSDRWSEDWPLVEDQLRWEAKQRRKELHQKHRSAKALIAAPLLTDPILEVGPDPETTIEPYPDQQPNLPKSYGPGRPAANHPWRHSPIGRALYKPTTPAKN